MRGHVNYHQADSVDQHETVEENSDHEENVEDCSESQEEFIEESTTEISVASPSLNCHMCEASHCISECDYFLDMSLDERRAYLKANKICYKCLVPQHCFRKCLHRCNSCNGNHHFVLHDALKRKARTQHHSNQAPPTSTVQSTSSQSNVFSHQVEDNDDCFLRKVVPVRIYKKNGRDFITTYAMFDDATDQTLIDLDFFNKLDLDFVPSQLTLKWTQKIKSSTESSKRSNIVLQSTRDYKKYTLNNVFTVNELELAHQSFDPDEMTKKFNHLRGISLHKLENVQPTILIGIAHAHLHILNDHRRSSDESDMFSPIASLSIFGWIVWGPTKNPQSIVKSSTNYHSSCQSQVASVPSQSLETVPLIQQKSDCTELSVPEMQKQNITNIHVPTNFTKAYELFKYVARLITVGKNATRAGQVISQNIAVSQVPPPADAAHVDLIPSSQTYVTRLPLYCRRRQTEDSQDLSKLQNVKNRKQSHININSGETQSPDFILPAFPTGPDIIGCVQPTVHQH